nr:set1 complex component sdc1 [Quercus suber]
MPTRFSASRVLRGSLFTLAALLNLFALIDDLKLGLKMADATSNGTDVEMKDEAVLEQADPTDPNPPPQAQSTPAEAPSMPEHLSTITPGISTTSPAASGNPARPGSMPPQPAARPEKPVAHGGPTRQYLNQNITPHLLEGMKYLAAYEPEKPLLWLADFLRDRSKEVED